MKTLLTYILFTCFALGQSTTLRTNVRLDADVRLVRDTIFIQSDILITDLRVIHRINSDTSEPTVPPIREYGFNRYKLPMSNYNEGTYTVIVEQKGNLYPFNFIRLQEIEKTPSDKRWIIRYECEYGTRQSFSQYSGVKHTDKREIQRWIDKYKVNRMSRNGYDNWLKVYAIYNDESKALVYEVN